MEFPGEEYWSGLSFPPPGDLPAPGIKSESPTLQADSLLSELPGKAIVSNSQNQNSSNSQMTFKSSTHVSIPGKCDLRVTSYSLSCRSILGTVSKASSLLGTGGAPNAFPYVLGRRKCLLRVYRDTSYLASDP